MTRYLLSIFLLMAINLNSPMIAAENVSVEVYEPDFQNVTITISESTIRVTGASGQILVVYNLAGVRVASIKIDSSDKHFDLNLQKGCYIVQVGKVVRKVAIR